MNLLAFSTSATPPGGGDAMLALLVLAAGILIWLGVRVGVRRLRAARARDAVGDDFASFALAALANAAKLDGRFDERERQAITDAASSWAAPQHLIETALSGVPLSKDELVAFLEERAGGFTREQKASLLKALISVFVADGRFDEVEHAALVDYTAAIGFDRRGAPEVLRGLMRDFQRGAIT